MSHTPSTPEQAEALREHYKDQPVVVGRVPPRTFELTRSQCLRALQFQFEHECSLKTEGAIGGAYTYTFTDTNLGFVQRAVCACGAEIDLTDYSDW